MGNATSNAFATARTPKGAGAAGARAAMGSPVTKNNNNKEDGLSKSDSIKRKLSIPRRRGSATAKQVPSAVMLSKSITLCELEKHNKPEDCWVAIKGSVYDVTQFAPDHPGGASSLTEYAGGDATASFELSFHPASYLLQLLLIGELVVDDPRTAESTPECSLLAPTTSTNSEAAVSMAVAARESSSSSSSSPSWIGCTVMEKLAVGPDAVRLKLKASDQAKSFVVPIGQHVYLRARVGGGHEKAQRAYSPIDCNPDENTLEFVIRVYRPGMSVRYPEGGLFTQILDGIEIGDCEALEISRPQGRIQRCGAGSYQLSGSGVRSKVEHLVMIAGGTGIAPLLRLIRAVLEDGYEEVTLLYSSQSDANMVLKEELEALSEAHPQRLHLTLVTSEGAGGRRIDETLIHSTIPPPPTGGVLALVCGSPEFADSCCLPALRKAGYEDRSIFVF